MTNLYSAFSENNLGIGNSLAMLAAQQQFNRNYLGYSGHQWLSGQAMQYFGPPFYNPQQLANIYLADRDAKKIIDREEAIERLPGLLAAAAVNLSTHTVSKSPPSVWERFKKFFRFGSASSGQKSYTVRLR